MGFTLTNIIPNVIFNSGGHELVINGVFNGGCFQVYIGDKKDTSDLLCYSGKPGQGTLIYPIANTKLKVYSPRIISSGNCPFSIYVVNTVNGQARILSNVLTVVETQFYTSVYALRKVYPPHYKTGSRNISLEKRIQ